MKKQILVFSLCIGQATILAEQYTRIESKTVGEDIDQLRCGKCEERDKEKRQKLAHVILASIAQFFQGMLTLAHGGKDLDDKAKVEQGVLMVHAVGNIIYQAQELDRYIQIGSEDIAIIDQGASPVDRKSTLHKKCYDKLQSELVELILLNPEWVRDVMSNARTNLECLRVVSDQQQHEVPLCDSSSEFSVSCRCCTLMSRN